MPGKVSIRVGGWSLIVGAAVFMVVFSYLAAAFDYPDVLDGPAESVLPSLLATGGTGRAIWAVYSFLPLLWIPAGVGAYAAFRHSHPGSSFLAAQCAVVAALAMMLGLMRWPTVHWRLAELYVTADPDQRVVLGAIFDGLNTYLGNYIGEFLGEFAFNLFFVLTSWALFKTRAVARGIAAMGLATAIAGLVGMFRNLADAVAPIAELNNYLLPLWMTVFGIILLRWKPVDPSQVGL